LALRIEVVPTIVLPALPFSSAPLPSGPPSPSTNRKKREETGAYEEELAGEEEGTYSA
jgi:hypothetical protein